MVLPNPLSWFYSVIHPSANRLSCTRGGAGVYPSFTVSFTFQNSDLENSLRLNHAGSFCILPLRSLYVRQWIACPGERCELVTYRRRVWRWEKKWVVPFITRVFQSQPVLVHVRSVWLFQWVLGSSRRRPFCFIWRDLQKKHVCLLLWFHFC